MAERNIRVGILGAGAIGRGYIARLLDEAGYEVHLLDRHEGLIQALSNRGRYISAMSVPDAGKIHLVEREIPVASANLPTIEEIRRFDLIVLAVGPRNVPGVAPLLAEARGPIICMENDRGVVKYLRLVLRREDVYFSVPDVITSSTAPAALLERDPFALSTERGEVFIESSGLPLPLSFKQISTREMDVQWHAKFYIHNTPHAVAAYLGARAGLHYLHETMAIPELAKTVQGVVHEMVETVAAHDMAPLDMAHWYGEKELQRFANPLLSDPIARVAREPLRKLERGGRLIGAAELALAAGIIPGHLFDGILAAIGYEDRADIQLSLLRRALPPEDFVAYALGLQDGHPLRRLLARRMERTPV